MARYGMLLNLDRCIGCYACVVACKMAHGTRPGVNYNAVNTVEWGTYPNAHQRFVLTMCMQCEDAPCVAACPAGATTKSEEGPVLMDYETCIGCGACVEACPYKQRHLVADDINSYEGVVAPYEEESDARLNVVEKCNFCYERVKAGKLPACSEFCPGQCRIFGDIDDPESEISKAIATLNPIHIEGTSIYYVVPEGMDRSLLPLDLIDAIAKKNEGGAETMAPEVKPEQKQDNNTGVVIGLAAAAAVAGGIAYGYNKNKKKGAE